MASRRSGRGGRAREGRQREHRPHILGPRVYRAGRSRYWRADLRPWGGGRIAVRNPKHPGWPTHGERTEDEDIARAWSWAYVDMLRDGVRSRLLGTGRARKVGEAMDDYLAHRMETVAPNTYSADRTALAHLATWAGRERRVDRIVARAAPAGFVALQELFGALSRKGYEPTTLYTYRKSMSTFFRWLGGANPASEVALPKTGRTDPDIFTDEDLAELRKAADRVDAARGHKPPSARLMLELAAATGCRQEELYALEWRRFSAEKRTVRIVHQLDRNTLRPVALKGKLARTTLVLPDWWDGGWYDPDARGLVLCRADGRPVGYRPQRHLIDRIYDAAGLNAPGRGYHALRHLYARRFIEQGGRLEELQRSLGHKSIRTTEAVYSHLSADTAAENARRRIYREEGLRVVR